MHLWQFCPPTKSLHRLWTVNYLDALTDSPQTDTPPEWEFRPTVGQAAARETGSQAPGSLEDVRLL